MSTGLPVQTEFSEQQRACSADMDRDVSCQVLAWCSVEDFHREAGFKQLFFSDLSEVCPCVSHPLCSQRDLSISPHGVTLARSVALDHYRESKTDQRKENKTGQDGRDYRRSGRERTDQTEEEERRSVWTGYVRLWKRWCCEPFRRIVADKGI